jgi:hypothetical protein
VSRATVISQILANGVGVASPQWTLLNDHCTISPTSRVCPVSRPASEFFYQGSEMMPLACWSLLLVLGVSCYAQNLSASKGVPTTIEATELDRRMLLENLNTHDQDHCMRFELAESDYDYRIVFSTGQGDSIPWQNPLRHK